LTLPLINWLVLAVGVAFVITRSRTDGYAPLTPDWPGDPETPAVQAIAAAAPVPKADASSLRHESRYGGGNQRGEASSRELRIGVRGCRNHASRDEGIPGARPSRRLADGPAYYPGGQQCRGEGGRDRHQPGRSRRRLWRRRTG
jgi:hypothetical protein